MEVILARRSNRHFDENKAVPDDLVKKVVDAGLNAPSAMNQQIYVVKDQEFLRKIGKTVTDKVTVTNEKMRKRKEDMKRTEILFYDAPVVLMITVAKENLLPAGAARMIDIGLCSQNILLACQALGLAAVPVLFSKIFAEADIKEYLKYDDAKEELAITIPIGYPASMDHFPAKTVDDKAKSVWM